MEAALKELEQAAKGLFFISETDAPFNTFVLPAGTTDIENALRSAAGAGAQASVSKESAEYFLRNHTKADGVVPGKAAAFQHLLQLLQKQLAGLQVYRVGETKVAAFLAGRLPDGSIGGLRTELVET